MGFNASFHMGSDLIYINEENYVVSSYSKNDDVIWLANNPITYFSPSPGVRENLDADKPVRNRRSGSGTIANYSIDVGLFYRPTVKLSIGASFLSLGQNVPLDFFVSTYKFNDPRLISELQIDNNTTLDSDFSELGIPSDFVEEEEDENKDPKQELSFTSHSIVNVNMAYKIAFEWRLSGQFSTNYGSFENPRILNHMTGGLNLEYQLYYDRIHLMVGGAFNNLSKSPINPMVGLNLYFNGPYLRIQSSMPVGTVDGLNSYFGQFTLGYRIGWDKR
jgi:hypothetical protein